MHPECIRDRMFLDHAMVTSIHEGKQPGALARVVASDRQPRETVGVDHGLAVSLIKRCLWRLSGSSLGFPRFGRASSPGTRPAPALRRSDTRKPRGPSRKRTPRAFTTVHFGRVGLTSLVPSIPLVSGLIGLLVVVGLLLARTRLRRRLGHSRE